MTMEPPGVFNTTLSIPIGEELVGRRRSANFTESELITLVMLYRDYLDVFQSRDKRSEAMRARKDAYDAIARRLNAEFPVIQRSGKQVAEKVKHLLSELRRFPHVKSPDDPSLPALKPWQSLIVDIIRSTESAHTTSNVFYHDVDDSNSRGAATSDEIFHALPEEKPQPYFEYSFDQGATSSACERQVSLEDARMELITLEKEKIVMEKELIAWKIKNAQMKNALMAAQLRQVNELK